MATITATNIIQPQQQRVRCGSLSDSSESSSMTIFVVEKDAHILFGVDHSDTVRSLKSRIASRQGIPLDQQRLLFAGQPMDDASKLSDYKIRPQSCIQLDM